MYRVMRNLIEVQRAQSEYETNLEAIQFIIG